MSADETPFKYLVNISTYAQGAVFDLSNIFVENIMLWL